MRFGAMTNTNAQHRWIVDSIEESVASVEVDGDRMITVPQSLLPSGAKSGQVLRVQTHPLQQFKIGEEVAIEVDATQCSVFRRAIGDTT